MQISRVANATLENKTFPEGLNFLQKKVRAYFQSQSNSLQNPSKSLLKLPAEQGKYVEQCLQKIKEKPDSPFWRQIANELIQNPPLEPEHSALFAFIVTLNEIEAQDALQQYLANGPLKEVGFSVVFDPLISFWLQFEAKEELENLYRVDGLCLAQIQEKISSWYYTLLAKEPIPGNDFANYLTFKKAFKDQYFSLQKEILDTQANRVWEFRASKAYQKMMSQP